MEYRVLGPLEVRGSEGPLPLGGTKQRALLALLLLNANRVVSRERLIDDLWGDEPPETAVTSVHVYVSRLRKLLPDDTLVTRPPGYVLEVNPDAIDLLRFERLFAAARSADPKHASSLLREALALWRGPALAEFAGEPFALAEAGRLDDARLAALEERNDADLALGHHADVLGELETLVAEHPHRERLRGQLMLALYRSGRQAEALEAYREARAALDELGIEPSESLRQLEKAILTQDSALDTPRSVVSGSLSLPGPLRAISPFPFVGRAKELQTLRSLLALAERGEGGQVALIGGEAGSGKTRLARELAQEAVEGGTLVLYGASHADVNMPYQPFVEALDFLVRVSDPSALEGIVGKDGDDVALLVPGLGRSTGSPVGDPDVARRRLHNAVTALLTRVSSLRPLLVVVDDIHWADSSSVQLLHDLTRAAPEGRIFVLVTYRDRTEDVRPELAAALAGLSRLEGMRRVRVNPLTTDDIGEFVTRLSGATASSQLTEAMGSLTDGTPFLVCELWRALLETDAVDVSDTGVTLTRPVAELNSPESVRDVVHYRLSRLAPDTTALLEVAAVAGQTFDLRILGDERSAIAAAEEGVASGMIEAVAETGVAHRFTHELVRRALYNRLTSVRRAELHLRVGEALEQVHAADLERFLHDLAHHFTLAAPLGGVERAVEYNRRAAEAAMATLAYDDAARLLSDALELVHDDRIRAEVAGQLGFALRHSGEDSRAKSVLMDGIAAAEAADDPRLAAVASIALAYFETSLPESAEREIARAIGVFVDAGDDLNLSRSWHALGHLEWSRGQFGAAAANYSRALVYGDRAGARRERTSALIGLTGAALHGPTPVLDAIAQCESILADSNTTRTSEAFAASNLAVLKAMAGRFAEARALVARSIAICTEIGLERRLIAARSNAAMVEVLDDDLAAAELELRFVYETAARLDAPGDVTYAAGALADVLCRQRRFDEAVPLIRLAREGAEPADAQAQVTWRCAEAKVAAANADFPTAEQTLRAAAAIAAATDALDLQARVQVDLADVLLASGKGEHETRSALEKALDLYRRKGNAVESARTEARLANAFASLDPAPS